ncbi:sensor domain-containing diguanylate cyclase [Janthinobacterium agaricidamnosum]|uniref:Sensory box protein n=1 Tax=Janthinobacterium agaricidamnosum NBRC 102515 = DSM 9628 TaxID=1349767 RepID=W0V4C8_9BURK|nr:diguanylate cyclase [Janthinobacterium agaricidamnosum]CDG82213.1 sensory box protein [Janthinobacterium agaricidamnosum NBRC 102515 = DSM 9628]
MISKLRTTRHLLHRLYPVTLLPAFALVLLLALWSAVFYHIDQERQTAVKDAVFNSQSLARTLSDHISYILRQTDHATQLFKLKYEETGGALRLDEFTRRGGLLDSVLPSRLNLPIALIGTDGSVIDSANAYMPAGLAHETFFKTLRSGQAEGPLFDTPVMEADSKKWLIRISRRLNDARGQFAGAIVIMLDPTYFVDDYDRLNVDEDGALMLIARDSGLAVGRIGEKLIVSDKIDFFVPGEPQYPADQVLITQPPDRSDPLRQIERIYSYRDLPRYPLLAVVGVTRQVALAKFEQRRYAYFIALLVFTALIIGFIALLMRQSRRLQDSMREVRQAGQEVRHNHSFLQSLIDHLPVLVYVKSARPEDFGRMVVWNKAAERVTGYNAGDVIGKHDDLAFAGAFSLDDSDDDRRLLAEQRVIDSPEKPFMRPDGTLRHLHTVSVPVLDDEQQTEYILCIAEDVSQRRLQELALRQNQAELAAVNDASPLGLVRLDQECECTYVNRTFELITGLPRADALGAGWMSPVHPDDDCILMAALEQLGRTRQPFQVTLRCLHRDAKVVWVSLKIAAILIDGRIEGYVGSLDDITTLRESEVALLESEARLRTIANTLPTMVAYVDADQIYRFQNLAYEREFSLTGIHVLGRTVREIVGDIRYPVLEQYILRVLKGETLSFEEEDQKDGIERCMEVIYIPQTGEDGRSVVGFHAMRQDITAQKREKQRLLKLTQVDALTGLTNRAGFLQKLSDAMLACQETRGLMAVMYMDIDRFKPVNDTYGHGVGDALLRAFSNRLTQAMRASDTIARLGGDEFTIIMEKIGKPEDAAVLAAKIVSAMQAPFELDGVSVDISASIGLAFYRDEAISPAALLKQADVLLYQAKQAGRNTYRSSEIAL